MKLLLQEIRSNPLLWLLVFVPIALVAEKLNHEAHTLHFILSVLAILPLAVLLSHATESVAAKTGDSVGGLLNATLGNLTELVIAIAALQASQYTLVKASVAGVIVTNSLFMLGASSLLGGLRYHVQEFNRVAARFPAGLLFLATIGLLIPSAVAEHETLGKAGLNQELSLALSFLLLLAYGLGLWFSLNSHREFFASAEEEHEAAWPIGLALATLAVVTILVALVSEVFVGSVQYAATAFGMSPAFVGFIIVALVGAAAEMAAAFSATRKSSRSECRHCTWQRRANCALRCSGSGAAQLFDRTRTNGFEFVAGSGGNDFVRNAHFLARDDIWSFNMVCWSDGNYGLPDIRHRIISFAAGVKQMNDFPVFSTNQ
jgi:Ca2+:H+ antiporter